MLVEPALPVVPCVVVVVVEGVLVVGSGVVWKSSSEMKNIFLVLGWQMCEVEVCRENR